MNRNRTIALIGLALATLAMAQDVTLRRELKPQSTDKYKMTSESKMLTDIPNLGEQEMTVRASMTYALATNSVADEKANVSLTLSDIDYKMEGPMAELMAGSTPPTPKEMKFKGMLDGRNRLSELKFDGTMDMMAMMMSSTMSTMSIFIEFPEKAVKVGDTWDVVVPANKMIGNEETKFKATLVGDKGDKWQLKMNGELKIKNDLSEMMKGQDPTGTGLQMQMVITGTMKLESEALVDKATGKTVEMTTVSDSDTVTDIVNMGIKSGQKAKSSMKLVLQP